MQNIKNIFSDKKILIYGLGKTGVSTFNFLKNKKNLCLYDDKNIYKNDYKISKYILTYKNLVQNFFDYIVVSPGIDINKCHLSSFIKKNSKKIITDLDIFYSLNKNKNITITGTNGKSTTAKLLHEVLKNQNYDVRLVGNIGNPILLEKKIKKKTIFVIEASSYQLEYSQFFKSTYAAILNISSDHLERHKTLKKYIEAKFKLIKNQSKSDLAFLNKSNPFLKKEIDSNKIFSKIINVDNKIEKNLFRKINNPYFMTDSNKQNLSFIIEISKKLRLSKKKLLNTLNKFKGLSYRQEIIYRSKKLTIINDSKATSYSSTISLLKSLSNVYWLVGGIPKMGDKFLLSKRHCTKFRAYIFGTYKKKFSKELKDKIHSQTFENLKMAVEKIFIDIKKNNNYHHNIILFSPSGASFDHFKNFEERGLYFNKLVKRFVNAR
jgi:UDP-N-acetylmuramoylalanine--D-glutamate ligase